MSDQDKDTGGQSADDGAGVLLLRICEEHKLDPFCDYLSTPSVVIPSDEYERHWPLQSTRVRSWLAEIYFQEYGRLAAEKDIAQVLRVLEGRAWNKQRRSPRHESLWSAIERDPVASALVCFANQEGSFDGLTRELFMKLKDPQITDRLGPLARQLPVNGCSSRGAVDESGELKTDGNSNSLSVLTGRRSGWRRSAILRENLLS